MTGFRVYERCGSSPYSVALNLSAGQVQATREVADGQTCWWRVTALNGFGESAPSDEGSKTFGAGLALPGAPENLVITWAETPKSMAISLVKSAKGTSTSGTVAWGFGSATTAGNLIVGIIAADDYNGTPTTGWTQSSEMEQQGFHGAYIWWRISTGETNPQAYTIGSATNSAWILLEFSGLDTSPYDTSQGLIVNSSGNNYATDNATPTAGERLLVAMIGGSLNQNLAAATVGSWTNSFTGIDSVGSGGSGTNDLVGAAYRIVTANGSTAYSTAADLSVSAQSRSALIIAFKAAAGGGAASLPPRRAMARTSSHFR